MKRQLCILAILIATVNIYSQSKEELLKKVVNNYAPSVKLQFTSVYNLYKSYNDKFVQQSYTGCFSRNGAGSVYAKIHNTEFYWNKNVTAKISHDEKIIQVFDPLSPLVITQPDNDLKKLLSEFKHGYFKDHKTYYELELLSKSTSSLPFSRVILQIGKDFFLIKQVFFYSQGHNFSKDYRNPDIQKPRLEILYSKPTSKEESVSIYSTDQFFTITKKRLNLAGRYSAYEILDQRTPSSK